MAVLCRMQGYKDSPNYNVERIEFKMRFWEEGIFTLQR